MQRTPDSWLPPRSPERFSKPKSRRIRRFLFADGVAGSSSRRSSGQDYFFRSRAKLRSMALSGTREPFVYRFADPALGEQNRPVGGAPAVSLAFDRGLEWIPAAKPLDRLLRLTVQSYSTAARTYTLRVLAPRGLTVDSVTRTLALEPLETRELFIRVRGMLAEGRYEFGVIAEGEMGRYAVGFRTIEYPHINPSGCIGRRASGCRPWT